MKSGRQLTWRQLALAAVSMIVMPSAVKAADFPQPYPRNYISYEAGGLMTRSVKMLVDLDKGIGWLAEAQGTELGNRLPGAKVIDLGPSTLKRLNDLASEVVQNGMQTRRCAEAEARARLRDARKRSMNAHRHRVPPPPIFMQPMDAMIFYSVRVEEKTASRPTGYDCETKASKQLYSVLDKSLHMADAGQ